MKSPIDETKMVCYFPIDNPSLIEKAQQAGIVSNYMQNNYPLDAIRHILSFLKMPKDLARASQVCKHFYKATKHPALWVNLLKQNLPYANTLSPCSYSEEQQVKIIFQRILAEKKQISEAATTLLDQIKILDDKIAKTGQLMDELRPLRPFLIRPRYISKWLNLAL